MSMGLLFWRQRGRSSEKSAEIVVGPKDRRIEFPRMRTSGEDSMETEQQGRYEKPAWASSCLGAISEGGTGAKAIEERQSSTAETQDEFSTGNLMEKVCARWNLCIAAQNVRDNKGSPGVDGMSITVLEEWLAGNEERLRKSLLEGTYQPQPVLGVQIPKAGGGMRQLGIPTVVDRLVQQAILQILQPILDPTFSESSYGFRPGRSAHQALRQASEYVFDGRKMVVDIDLEKFFDRVNHDILMARLARRIKDKRLLKLVRKYLRAGLMANGVKIERGEGTPQGGPLSPLLANLLLDDLDKELEKRGHRFCRYADDCNIYVKTEAAGARIMQSITEFLEKRLKLRVNRDKSAVAEVHTRKFLGYRILSEGRLTIAPKSVEKMKDKIRETTRKKQPLKIEWVIQRVNQQLIGWVNYFRMAECGSILEKLDGWIRRKLRCYKLNQMRRPRTLVRFLMNQGIEEKAARQMASSGKGTWRLSLTRAVHKAMDNQWFEKLGLKSGCQRWTRLQT